MSWRDREEVKDQGFVRDAGYRRVDRPKGARSASGRRLKESIRRKLTEVRKRVIEEMGEMAHEVLAEAQDLAPKDTLELVESGYVDQQGERWIVGFRAEHAAAQHERLDYEHDDGQAKYLETALDNAAARAQRRLAEAAREVL